MTALRVHAEIERAIPLVGKTARRIIHLHGREPQISKNNVRRFGKNLRKTCKIRPVHRQGIRTKPECTQTSFGFRELDGIQVEADKPAAGLESGEKGCRMTTIAERAVYGEFA